MARHFRLNIFTIVLSLGISGLTAGAQPGDTIELPGATTFPVVFEHTIDAAHVKPGDTILAKTIEAVPLPGGELPKGTVLTGHVVDARPFHFNPVHYAVQQPSYLSIHFDKVTVNGRSAELNVFVRALANRDAASEASRPQSYDDTDHLGTMILVGGDNYSPIGERVMSPDDQDIVGYIHKQGAFARLLPADASGRSGGVHCDGSQTEQPVGIFSADACGVYGFVRLSMDADNNGNVRLESPHSTVKLYGGSAALLEEVAPR